MRKRGGKMKKGGEEKWRSLEGRKIRRNMYDSLK